jgi:3-oxoacyl-[acyl-carrier protein] reductase
MHSIKDKTIFITGGASGIGQYLAQKLYQSGAKLIVSDINYDALLLDFEKNKWQNDRILLLKLDVSKWDSWNNAVQVAMTQFQNIDILINNAGIIVPGYIHETNYINIDKHIDINLKGVIYGTKLASEHMMRQGYGQIINVSSLAGITPGQGLNLYCASKFGVRGFTLSVAAELRPHNIFVSVVCPDAVDTPMFTLQKDYDEAALTFSGTKALTVEQIGEVIIKKAILKRKIEIIYPISRGILAKLSSLFPSMGLSSVSRSLIKKGLKNQEKYRKIYDNTSLK